MLSNNTLSSWNFGGLKVRNKIFMASMTRCRGEPGGEANEMMRTYYDQRTKHAGLVMTGIVWVEKRGDAYPGECGLETKSHMESWKPIIATSHKNKCPIVAQIYHGGRVVHHEMIPNDTPIAPSAIKLNYTPAYIGGTKKSFDEPPRALETSEIKEIIQKFRKSAELAKEAGFDGIELHGANGYLVDQFLRSGTNQRDDEYGGGPEGRCRFALEIIDEFIQVFPANRVGMKITPVGRFNEMYDENPVETFSYLMTELNKRKIWYVQISDPEPASMVGEENWGGKQIPELLPVFRPYFQGPILTNGFKEFDVAQKRLDSGQADGLTFATHYIANPDLPYRIKKKIPLEKPNPQQFYAPGPQGYIDWPSAKGRGCC